MARPITDMTGQRYGRLTVSSLVGSDSRGKPRWLCRCDCGQDSTVLGQNLRNGATRSCGCFADEMTRKVHKQRFGQWFADEQIHPRTVDHPATWRCVCDCGRERNIRADRLIQGLESCVCSRPGGAQASRFLNRTKLAT